MPVEYDEFGGIKRPVDRDEFGGVPTRHSNLPTAEERPPVHYDFDPSIAVARTGLSGFAADLAERMNRQRLNLQAGLTFGGAEEMRAGLQAAPEALMDWYKTGNFDYWKHYTPLHQQLESMREQRIAQNPVAARVEEVTGGVAGALGAGQAGLSFAGRQLPQVVSKLAPRVLPKVAPYVAAGAESGAYGTTQAALTAKPGERIEAATKAAPASVLAGVAGEATMRGLSALDDIFTKRVPVPTGVTSETQKALGRELYDRATAEGVRYHPDAFERLRVNVRAAAERLDPHGRPLTSAITKDVMKRPAGSYSFEDFHMLQKRISKAIRTTKNSEDKEFLERLQGATDSWARKIDPKKDVASNHPGDPLRAYQYKKGADLLWVQHKKLEFLEDLEEMALTVGKGHLTQSGVANAVKQLTLKEFRKIKAGNPSAGWNKKEIEQIKQMASGDSSTGTIKLLSRFAPRGPVASMAGSVAGGQLLGWLTSQLGVPAIVAHSIPLGMGAVAVQKADQNAVDALETLRQGIAGIKPYPRPAPPPAGSITGAAGAVGLTEEQRRRGL